jgi:hypothetical protein
MRLRDFVLRLSLGSAGALAREDYTTARPSSPSFSALGLRLWPGLGSSCVRYVDRVDRNDQGCFDHDYREARS